MAIWKGIARQMQQFLSTFRLVSVCVVETVAQA